ncbi:MAG TPA: hypothetical protein VFC99_01295 [Acidimicrobiia bacterium]|nr:hypothetical protein [Acidimicrobiia bacterium]
MTDDLRDALVRLSERGEPAGVEALLERIETDLAAGPGRTASIGGGWRLRFPWGRRALFAATLALVVALVAAALVVAPGSRSGTRRVASNLAMVPERLEVSHRAALPRRGRPARLLVPSGGSLWTTSARNGGTVLYRLDGRTGRRLATVELHGRVVDLAAGFGSVWVVAADRGAGQPGRLVRLDARTGAVQAEVELATPARVATGAGAVWVTDPDRGVLDRIDPRSDRVDGTLAVPGATAVAVAGRSVLVVDTADDLVVTVDAPSLQVLFRSSGIDPAPESFVVSGSRVWAISDGAGSVVQLDRSGAAVGPPVRLQGPVTGAAAGSAGAVWLAHRGGSVSVGLLQPGRSVLAPAERVRRIPADALAVSRNGLWVLDTGASTLTRLEAR